MRRLIATGRVFPGTKTIHSVIDNHPDSVAEKAGLQPWFPKPKPQAGLIEKQGEPPRVKLPELFGMELQWYLGLKGKRIRTDAAIEEYGDPSHLITAGATGRVQHVDKYGIVYVKFEDGRVAGLIPSDRYVVVQPIITRERGI